MREIGHKKTAGARRYFRNLWRAVTGTDPFRAELDELRRKYDLTACKVASMTGLYFGALERRGRLEQQITGFQSLVENLRGRIVEKDRMIRLLQEELDRR